MILNIQEAAEFLKVSKTSLRRWEKQGKLTSFKTPGNHRRYELEDLKKFITKNDK